MRIVGYLALALAAAVLAGCGGASEVGATGSTATTPPRISVTPGQEIWVAVLATAKDPAALDGQLAAARTAVGDYLADRVVVKDASCFEGLPQTIDGTVLAIQDRAEHGVHAMYEEITDAPVFYGEITLVC